MDTSSAYAIGQFAGANFHWIVIAIVVFCFAKDLLQYTRESIKQVIKHLFHEDLPALAIVAKQKVVEGVKYHNEIKNSESRKEPTIQLESEAPAKSDDCADVEVLPVKVASSVDRDWEAFDVPAFVRKGITLNF